MIPELADNAEEVRALCKQYGVSRLEAFGSSITGTYGPQSDLDFLVEFNDVSKGYADRYFSLLQALQDLFGRPVQLVIESAIQNPYFKESIDKSRTLLYAA
jgi:predicted nucleotidyltransferase